jgi:hypothetical protein
MVAMASASKVATILARYQEKGKKRKRNEKEGGPSAIVVGGPHL